MTKIVAYNRMPLPQASPPASAERFAPESARQLPSALAGAVMFQHVLHLVWLATGAGAESQRAIGTGVIGGMLSATILGVLFVPVFFVWVLSVIKSRRRTGSDAATEAQENA